VRIQKEIGARVERSRHRRSRRQRSVRQIPDARTVDDRSFLYRHQLRYVRIRILKFPKIHEFLRILKLSILKFIKFKLSH